MNWRYCCQFCIVIVVPGAIPWSAVPSAAAAGRFGADTAAGLLDTAGTLLSPSAQFAGPPHKKTQTASVHNTKTEKRFTISPCRANLIARLSLLARGSDFVSSGEPSPPPRPYPRLVQRGLTQRQIAPPV